MINIGLLGYGLVASDNKPLDESKSTQISFAK